jgi:hypothetical protein
MVRLVKITFLIVLGIIITIVYSFLSKHYYLFSADSQPLAWVVPSQIRIGLEDKPGNDTEIQLYAARGEYESFQIGIKAPSEGLKNVNVTVSDLSATNKEVISSSNITLYREHYIYVAHPSPKGILNQKPGWYADGLIPFVNPDTNQDLTGSELDAVPFNLKQGNNQPIWVDIFVPRDAKAGEYKGQFTVKSDQGEFIGKISLNVANFELPLQPSFNSAFAFWDEKTKSSQIELLKHKLMPRKHINREDERELIDKWGLKILRLPFWSGANYHTCQMELAPSVQEIKAAAEQNQSDLLLYIYSVDEVNKCPNLYQDIKEWGKNIHQAGVKHLAVMTPVSDLYDYVDIWVIQPVWYNKETNRVKEVIAQGDEVWFYIGYKSTYAPQWQIDSEPIDWRIAQGFISQSLGLTGVLYWRADWWTDNPWEETTVYWQGKKSFPGEGMLVYPGEVVGIDGVVPSMRLKWLRDGVEDYEYIQILKQLGYEDWALEICREVGADWKNWTKNPEILESARLKLGNKIEEIYSQKKLDDRFNKNINSF